MTKRKVWFRPITDVAREVFFGYLKEFLDAYPQWTRYTLLRTAGMDPALLNRIEDGATFSTASLDKLLALMNDAVNGRITGPSKPKPRKQREREAA